MYVSKPHHDMCVRCAVSRAGCGDLKSCPTKLSSCTHRWIGVCCCAVVIAQGQVGASQHYWLMCCGRHVQAAAIMDRVARTVLPLLLRGVGLRSDALSGVLDDVNLPAAAASSCELHVARYRGPADGEQGLLRSLSQQLHGMQTRQRHGQNLCCRHANRRCAWAPSRGPAAKSLGCYSRQGWLVPATALRGHRQCLACQSL